MSNRFTKFSGNRFWINKFREFYAQCPYWIGHCAIKKRTLSNLLFEKWAKRPNASYLLYWKMHPEEYYMANKINEQKKKNKSYL